MGLESLRDASASALRYTACIALAACTVPATAQVLTCSQSPFGNSVLLQSEREVSMSMLGSVAPGGIDHLLYDGVATIRSRLNPATVDARLSALRELTSVALDLNGDGEDETALAGINTSGAPVVAIINANGGVIDTWAVNVSNASEMQIAAADLTGAQSGRRQLVIAYRLDEAVGEDTVNVVALFGNASGGLSAGDSSFNMLYTRRNTGARQFAITAGDFLLDGSDQVALVIAGEPAGNRRVFFDLIRFSPGAPTAPDPNTSAFSAIGYSQNQAPLDITNNSVAIRIAAAHWLRGKGKQLAVVINSESATSSHPFELWFIELTATRAAGTITGYTRTDLLHVDNTSLAVQVGQRGRYELVASDLNRDGLDELLLAYPNDTLDGVGIRAYRYRPAAPGTEQFSIYADYGYAFTAPIASENVRDIALAAGDIDGDGFPELHTAVADNSSTFELRRWNIEPVSAATMGSTCSGDIGSPSCPPSTYVPAPMPGGSPVSGRGTSLGGFAGEDATGTWTLCAADSGAFNTGSLAAWQLIVNAQAFDSTGGPAPIANATGSLDTCLSVTVPPAPPAPAQPAPIVVRTLEVSVSLNHPFASDITLELTSPRGKALTLVNRAGGNDNFNSAFPLRFSESASSSGVTTSYFPPSPNGSIFTHVALSMPDYDGDSVQAMIPASGSLCRTVVEESLTALVFSPPYFDAVQGAANGDVVAEIGTATSTGLSGEKTVTSVSGNEVSVFLGASIGGEVFGVGMSASARATAASNYESSVGTTAAEESELAFGTGDTGAGDTGGITQFRRRSYECYEYEVRKLGTVRSDSFVRMCELIADEEGKREVTDWNENVPTQGAAPPMTWAPITRDWANLALHGQVTASSGVAALANDGLMNNATAVSVAPQTGSYLLLDLGAERDLHSIRLHVPANRLAAFADVRVFAYRTTRPPQFNPAGPDVSVYAPGAASGGILPVHTISTLGGVSGAVVPKRARYIRISGPATGSSVAFGLTELQVFGESRREPNEYPAAVCDPIRRDGYFKLKQFVRGSVNDYRWIDAIGDAEWLPTLGECPAGSANSAQVRFLPIWNNLLLAGGGATSWFMEATSSASLQQNTGITNSTRRGAEFDVEAGAIVKIQAGGGYESSFGVSRESSTGTFWSRSLNVGGELPGVPTAMDECDYRPRPFQYRTTFRSNTGYEHQLMVVDYIVQSVLNGWSQAGGAPAVCLPAPDSMLFADGFE